MSNRRVRREKNSKDGKYLITDVTSLELTFKDGTKTKIKSISKDRVVQLKVYPNSMIENPFIFSVIENYNNGINATELAELCGYACMRTFQRHFKKNFNDTAYNWMLKRKLEDIQYLVINTDLPFSEISEIFQFKNQAHLTNVYKKHFGISPSKNREQEQGNREQEQGNHKQEQENHEQEQGNHEQEQENHNL